MASQRSKFMVGLFVAGGIIIAVIAFIWLGMAQFFQEGQYYATYFNESVQGLDTGSPLKYRGVTIGRVESIQVAPDSKLIEVVLKVETGQKLGKDLVAQLAAVGITGSMFVELDQIREEEPDRSPELDFPTQYPVIPSKPSNISQFMEGVDEVLKEIGKLDLKEVSDKIKITLDTVNQAVRDADVKRLSTQVHTSMTHLQEILAKDRWHRIIDTLEKTVLSLNILLERAGDSLDLAERSLTSLERTILENRSTVRSTVRDLGRAAEHARFMMEEGSLLMGDSQDSLHRFERRLTVILKNLETATLNLDRFLQTLADQPSQMLFGAPPAPRKIPSETGQTP